MQIRLASVNDLEALTALDTVARHDDSRATQIRNWVADQTCHAVEANGEIAAYGALHYHFFGCGFIELVMVKERFRRTGLGLALVNHLKSICTHPKLFTSTNSSNQAMQSLLKEAGFKESGYIENLDENDSELVFYVDLRGS